MGFEHGGLNYQYLLKNGISPSDVIDFSVSIFPDPLPPGFIDIFDSQSLTRYPDSRCYALRNVILKSSESADIESIMVTNGTSQAIFLIVSALLEKEDPVAIITPTYSQYEQACRLKTGRVFSIPMDFSFKGFSFPLEKIMKMLATDAPKLLWICSPNNPTGNLLVKNDFHKIYQACRKTGTILIIDEAYRCFVPGEYHIREYGESLLILRSMTKDYGIPGLRLGYILGDPVLIGKIEPWQPEWSINAPAQEAGIRCFAHSVFFKESWKRIAQRTQSLRQKFLGLGFEAYPTHSNFFLFQTADVPELKAHLWKDRILIRDCSSFGLDNYIRIGCNTEENNSRLLKSLEEYLEK